LAEEVDLRTRAVGAHISSILIVQQKSIQSGFESQCGYHPEQQQHKWRNHVEPLGHLEDPTRDYDFYQLDTESYEHCRERSINILEEGFKKFMGRFYNIPPKPTLIELKESYEHRLGRIKRLRELKAPKTILEYEEAIAQDLDTKIRQKDYGRNNDSAYKKYRKAYDDRVNQWQDSDDRDAILEAIFAYNEQKYAEAKEKHQPS